MNITQPTILGLVLALVVIKLIQKTVQQFLVWKKLSEVTRELTEYPTLIAGNVSEVASLVTGKVTGVARGVLSPPIPAGKKAIITQVVDDIWQEFVGGRTTFIKIKVKNSTLKKDEPFELVSLSYRKKKKGPIKTCLVFKKGDNVFVKVKKPNKETAMFQLVFPFSSTGLKFINHVSGIVRGQYRKTLREGQKEAKLEVAAI
jgi:hypothetical protein